MSAIDKDIEQIRAQGEVNFTAALIEAARKSGRSPISLCMDFNKFRRGRAKLKFSEYVMYELYDTDKYTEDERQRFISSYRHWPIVNQCNDVSGWSISEDKVFSAAILEHAGLPVPQTLGIYSQSPRHFGAFEKISGKDALIAFLNKYADREIFAKDMDGMWSAGAFRITGCDDTHVMIAGQDPVTYDALLQDILADRNYIFQTCLQGHSFFDGLTSGIATVRFLNLLHDDVLKTPYAVLKLPMGGNVADNFWRAGNALCLIDVDTGQILSIVTKDAGQISRHTALPDSDRALVGETLPDWQELRDANAKTALLHSHNRFGSTDMAITQDGPVVVEVNNGCAFELIQIATGKGLLSDDMLAFFKNCQVKF